MGPNSKKLRHEKPCRFLALFMVRMGIDFRRILLYDKLYHGGKGLVPTRPRWQAMEQRMVEPEARHVTRFQDEVRSR